MDIESFFFIIDLFVILLAIYGLTRKLIICFFALLIQIAMLLLFFMEIQSNQALLAFSILALLIASSTTLIKALSD